MKMRTWTLKMLDIVSAYEGMRKARKKVGVAISDKRMDVAC